MTPEREAELNTLPVQVAADKEWRIYLQRNDSIVVDYFQGQFRSRVECQTCHAVSFSCFISRDEGPREADDGSSRPRRPSTRSCTSPCPSQVRRSRLGSLSRHASTSSSRRRPWSATTHGWSSIRLLHRTQLQLTSSAHAQELPEMQEGSNGNQVAQHVEASSGAPHPAQAVHFEERRLLGQGRDSRRCVVLHMRLWSHRSRN